MNSLPALASRRLFLHRMGISTAAALTVACTVHHATPCSAATSATARPESITADSSAVRSRVVQRARTGNCSVAGVNVPRGHSGSAHTSRDPRRDHPTGRAAVGKINRLNPHPAPAQRQIDSVDHPIAGQVEDHARSVTQRARRLDHSSWSLSGWMLRNTHPSARPRALASTTHHAQLRAANNSDALSCRRSRGQIRLFAHEDYDVVSAG